MQPSMNPLIAPKLLFNLDAVHAAAKMDRENFQVGLSWLYNLAGNIFFQLCI